MINHLWVDEEWTWFPDGDETRAMTRVYIGTTRRDLVGNSIESVQTLLAEVCQFIYAKEDEYDSSKISIYGYSAFRDHVTFMYERAATNEEIGAEKTHMAEERASRIASLREEITKLEEK
jgi:hypothetical protein